MPAIDVAKAILLVTKYDNNRVSRLPAILKLIALTTDR
jgi:hypothetical protein